jgi:co-chaperonin GroES (HSP10)
MKVQGKIIPLKNNVLVSDMDFDMQKTASGIYIPSDNGKSSGIRPRWSKVWAVGPEQHDVKVGEWILVEHGRWTRTIEFELEDETTIELRMVETKSILASADEKPSDVERNAAVGAGSNFNFNIPGM